MKLLKDLAAFAVEECAVPGVAFLIAFSLWATSHMFRMACSTALVALAVIGVILNVLMIVGAMKLAYDDFQDFRTRRED